MRTLKWLCMVCVLCVVASAAGAQELARLTVNDVGTVLNVPELSISPQSVTISPDGRWIAYLINMRALIIKPLDGGPERLLYSYDQFAEQFKDDPMYNKEFEDYPYLHGNSISSIIFTPDSREITFQIDIYDSTLGSVWEFRYDTAGHWTGMTADRAIPYIKSINIETGEVRDITTGYGTFRWDSSGRLLTISRNFDPRAYLDPLQTDNHELLVVYDTVTKDKWALDNTLRGTIYGMFTNDGKHVIALNTTLQDITRPDGTIAEGNLFYRYPVNGGAPEQIACEIDSVYTRATDMVFSPDQKWLFFQKITGIVFSMKGNYGGYSKFVATLSVLEMASGKVYDLMPLTDNLSLVPLCLSPDGTKLYVSVADHYSDLFLNEDGSPQRYQWIVTYPFDPANLGKPFAFENVFTPPVVIDAGWGEKLDILNPDTNPLPRIPTFNLSTQLHTAPAWSPDGKTIAFLPGTGMGLWTVPAEGGQGILVYGGQDSTFTTFRQPSFSPDGQEIAFAVGGKQTGTGANKVITQDTIVSVDAASGTAQVLVTGTGYPAQQLRSPVWSPDGASIVYVIYTAKNDSLMQYDIATGESRLVLESSKDISRPSFATEGSSVVYADSDKLFRVLLAGGAPEQITVNDRHGIPYRCQNPMVHPDGIHILFKDTDAQNLKMVNTETGVVVNISPSVGGTVISPALSPDGSKICFEYRTPNELHILPLDESLLKDGNATVVADAPAAFPTLANYPNPFNPRTTVAFVLTEAGFTELSIYNMAGQQVRTLVSGVFPAGAHTIAWDGRDESGNPVSSGIFVSRLKSGDSVVTNRMTLVK